MEPQRPEKSGILEKILWKFYDKYDTLEKKDPFGEIDHMIPVEMRTLVPKEERETMGKKIGLLLCLALLLTGCAGRETAGNGSPAEVSPPAVQAAAAVETQGGDLSAVQVEAAARPLTQEEILLAYDRAVDMYSWFELSPLEDDGETVALDGSLYRRVEHPGVEDLEDLRTCLRSVFSEEVTERLLSGDGTAVRYRDIDGALYVSGQARSRVSGKGRASAQTEQQEEDVYSVSVAVELLDEDGTTVSGLEYWTFPYAFVNGRWVFTDFHLMY